MINLLQDVIQLRYSYVQSLHCEKSGEKINLLVLQGLHSTVASVFGFLAKSETYLKLDGNYIILHFHTYFNFISYYIFMQTVDT